MQAVRLFVDITLISIGMIICTLISTAQHRLTKTNRGLIPIIVRVLSIVLVWAAVRILSTPAYIINLLPFLLLLSSLFGSRMTVFGLTGGIACGKTAVSE